MRLWAAKAGWNPKEAVWALIPHGVFFEDDYVFPGEIEAKVPAVLNWPPHRDEIWSQYKTVVPAAAPFVYAWNLYEKQKQKRGSLVYPQHLTTLYDHDGDLWDFAEQVKQLPRPCTWMAYWEDLRRGFAKYVPAHVTIKTCGHVQDPEFLKKTVWHMSGAEYLFSNDIGSYTLYSTLAGCKFRLLHEPPVFRLNQKGVDAGYREIFHDSPDRHPEEKRRVAELDALFRDHDWDEPITTEQRESIEWYLRTDKFKDPAGLCRDFEYCRELHEAQR